MASLKLSSLTLAIVLGFVGITGCNKEELQPQEKNLSSGRVETGTGTVVVVPTISSITGTASNIGLGFWDGYLSADTHNGGNDFVINGTNFGITQGTGSVTLKNVTSYTIQSIKSWTNTKIVVVIKSNYNSAPAPSVHNGNISPVLSVKNNAGSVVEKSFKIVTRVTTKVYGQCVWYANLERARLGLSVQAAGQSYSNYTGSIDAWYVPRASDILIWHNAHQAFVKTVSSSATTWVSNKRNVTYTLFVTEYNGIDEKYSSSTQTVVIAETRNTSGTITTKSYIGNGRFQSALRRYTSTNYFR